MSTEPHNDIEFMREFIDQHGAVEDSGYDEIQRYKRVLAYISRLESAIQTLLNESEIVDIYEVTRPRFCLFCNQKISDGHADDCPRIAAEACLSYRTRD